MYRGTVASSKKSSANLVLLLGLIGCVGIVVLAFVGSSYFKKPPPPPAPPPSAAPSPVLATGNLKYTEGFYKNELEQDFKTFEIKPVPLMELALPNTYADELSSARKMKLDKDVLETPHIKLTTRVEKEWAVTGSGQGFKYEHEVLEITNKTDKFLAYRVSTAVDQPEKCRTKGAMQHNAIALRPGETVRRTECLWRKDLALTVKRVEVLELNNELSYLYVSRLLPTQILLDDRTSAGHAIPKGKGCSLVPWRATYRRTRWLLNATEGNRSEADAWDHVSAWNTVLCRPPLPENELRKTFDSARKAGDNPDYAAPPAKAPEGWPPTVPLPTHERPPFPLIALPDALRSYVESVTHTLQVPADLPALLGLAAVAAAGARVCRVQIGTTHAEPLNLYVAAVMEPGSRKSAAMEALSFPLQEAEREMVRDAAPALATAREQRAVQEKHQTVLRDKAAKAKAATERARLMQELGELAASLEDVPAAPRLLADDVTQEQLATLMAEQGGCMALFSAEGGIFGILAGRYNAGGTNLDLFLKSHNGDPFRVDRKGRPAEHIPYPCLTMGLTVQPDVLASLADTPSFRGRGLLGRFLYALPDSLVGTRLYDEGRALDDPARRHYSRTLRALLALPSPATPDDPGARHPLLLAGEALAAWKEYANDVERRQGDGGDLAGVRDWASKLAGEVARIAGCLHLAEHAGHACPWTVPISKQTTLAAWAIGEYLIPHALAAYGYMGADPRLTLARRILRWVERAGIAHFRRWECHQQMRDITSAEDLMPALALLCERHYLRPVEAEPAQVRGRPKGPEYEVHPDLHQDGHNK